MNYHKLITVTVICCKCICCCACCRSEAAVSTVNRTHSFRLCTDTDCDWLFIQRLSTTSC